MNTLITICARGGSKGLPNKHLLEFNGKPLIFWTVDQVFDWNKGDVVLSSDSQDIIQIAKEYLFCMAPYGFHNIIRRPNDLSGDDVPKLDVIRHALIETEKRTGKQYDIVVDLDATNPLRTVDDITGCWTNIASFEYPVSFSIVRARRNPYFNMVEFDNRNVQMCKGMEMDYFTSRQEAPNIYELNSCIYAYMRDWLLDEKHKSPIVSRACLWHMPDWTFCDIDTQVDFEVAEFLMRKYLIEKEI